MQERLGNFGYFAFKKESTKGVPLTPTNFLPFFDETLTTQAGFVLQKPVYGGKWATFDTLRGQRKHNGDITTLAEVNSLSRLVDAFATLASTSGAGPYVRTYEFDKDTNPNSFTADFSYGNVVKRFWGVQVSKMSPVQNENEVQMKFSVSALGSFQGRTIATVSTTTITLDTKYDPEPTKGLVVSDLVRIYKASDGTKLDTTIATVDADGVTLILGASAAAFAAGDVINLRPATPTYDLQDTLLWSSNKWHFGATTTAALAADHTPVEQGSTWELDHNFEDDGGAMRSGSLDPAALVRTTADATVTVKQFFDTPEKLQAFNDMDKSALAVRYLSGATSQYELQILIRKMTTDTPLPEIKADDVNYSTFKYIPIQDDDNGGKGVTIVIKSANAAI